MSTNLTLSGRLGADPELKYTPQGKAVASFSMVTSKPVKQDDGSWEDIEKTWYRVTVWDQQAENVAESLRKGDAVLVTGRLFMETYTTRDGVEKQALKVTAYEIGPSLKRAAADIRRTVREKPAMKAAATDDPWASPPADDEPPF